MTVPGVIFMLVGVAVAAYWHFHEQTQQVEGYRSLRDDARSGMIARVIETMGKALEPALVRLALLREELLIVHGDILLNKPTDVLKEVGVDDALRDYANDYSDLFTRYAEVKAMCNRLIASLRHLRKVSLCGAGGLFVLGLIATGLQAFQVPVLPWVQCLGLALITIAAVIIVVLRARQDALVDEFTDKCLALSENVARAE